MRYAIHAVRFGITLSLLLTLGCGPLFGPRRHATYVSKRIYNDCCPFRGIPVQIFKPYAAIVTWQSGDSSVTRSIHFILLPELFAVDAQKAFLGITDAKVELDSGGTLKKFDAKIDQEIPEILTSVSEILNVLPLDPVAAARYQSMMDAMQSETFKKNTFEPALDHSQGNIIGITWVPIEAGETSLDCN